MAKKKSQKGFNQSRCSKCNGMCCRYLALPIETPEDWKDYDDIRWYLYHEGVTVFVEEGDWYFQVMTDCKNICPETYKCQIYDKRPRICRSYSDENCDFTSEELGYDYELHFTSAEQMEEYMKIKFGNRVFDKLDPKAGKERRAKERAARKKKAKTKAAKKTDKKKKSKKTSVRAKS